MDAGEKGEAIWLINWRAIYLASYFCVDTHFRPFSGLFAETNGRAEEAQLIHDLVRAHCKQTRAAKQMDLRQGDSSLWGASSHRLSI